jgi:hypothetical protein
VAIDRGIKPGSEKSPAELIDDAEKKIERVRVLYNLYFQGIEKLEPAMPRAEIGRLMRDLRKLSLKSGLRFRFQNLLSRFSILEEQWSRTVRKIEEGRFRPHLFRLQLHEHGQVGPSSSLKSVATALGAFSKRSAGGGGSGGTRGGGGGSGVESGRDAGTSGSAAGDSGNLRGALALLKPLAGNAGGEARAPKAPDENRMKQILEDYVAARRQTGEPVLDVTLDAIRSAVMKQVPEIGKKHPCDRVDFKVVIRAGKAILKAVPTSEKSPEK